GWRGISLSRSMNGELAWRLTPQISRAVPRRRLHLLVRAAQFRSQTRTQVPRIERDKSQHHRKRCQDEHQNRIPRSTPAATDLGPDRHPHSRRGILTRPLDLDTQPHEVNRYPTEERNSCECNDQQAVQRLLECLRRVCRTQWAIGRSQALEYNEQEHDRGEC